ncbi:MAG: reverse transcriptase N-terminal domain-containing protein [Actinomycetota bacterium]|nr:reverse transcriptase N-terminal domain-containing protein [Actinomycetota bacterium]
MTTPEPKDKLGAMTTIMNGAAVTAPLGVAVVNEPEGELPDWHAIDWRASEQQVRRLRQRIFTVSQAGDLKRVRNTRPDSIRACLSRMR